MERPKRTVSKPSRSNNQTISSEDESSTRPPTKRVNNPPIMTDAEIDEDISELRRTCEDETTNSLDKINHVIFSQHPNSFSNHFHNSQSLDYPHTSTSAPPHTYTHHPTYTTLTTSNILTQNYNTNDFSSIPTHIQPTYPTHIHPTPPTNTHITSSTHTHPTRRHKRTDEIIDNSNTSGDKFQANVQEPGPINNEKDFVSRSNKETNRSIKSLQKRVDGIEAELKRMNTLLLNILKCVQDRRSTPRKPAILPISSLAQMDDFEHTDENCCTDVVNYFHYIGGFNLKEATNLCLKEALQDSLTLSFTWWGREEQRPLYNTRKIIAIYDAMCNNKYFPTRSEFQTQAKEALRAAKERARSRLRGPRARMANPRDRDFWNDQEPEEEIRENDQK